jgi:hypothetical protein
MDTLVKWQGNLTDHDIDLLGYAWGAEHNCHNRITQRFVIVKLLQMLEMQGVAIAKTPEVEDEKARLDRICDATAAEFFEGSGDMMAVSHSIRNVILARLGWVKEHGKDTGD